MNNIVKRYPLQSIAGLTQSIRMPMRADLIDVKMQRNNFWLYAAVSEEFESKELKEYRNIKMVITDHASSCDLAKHIATIVGYEYSALGQTEREFHFFEV